MTGRAVTSHAGAVTAETPVRHPSSPPRLEGWVRLWRQILLDPIWREIPATHAKVAVTILLMVGRRAVRLTNGIALAAGERLTSHEQIAAFAGRDIDRYVVRRAIKNLTRLGFLTARNAPLGAHKVRTGCAHAPAHPFDGAGIIVTVSNWKRYQGGDGGEPTEAHTRAHKVRTKCAHKQEERLEKSIYRRAEVDEGAARRPVAPAVLAAFLRVYDREPTAGERAVLTDLTPFPIEAVEAALRYVRDHHLPLTVARTRLRADANLGRIALPGAAS